MIRNPHPMQHVVRVGNVIRFRENEIVRYLLDHGGIDLNHLGGMPGRFSLADWEQFYQLIGYSVSGYGDLAHTGNVSWHSVAVADRRAERLP